MLNSELVPPVSIGICLYVAEKKIIQLSVYALLKEINKRTSFNIPFEPCTVLRVTYS